MQKNTQRVIDEVILIVLIACAMYAPQYKVENAIQTYRDNNSN